MNDQQLSNVIGQIKHNCNISDAKYGGNLSLCNMLLRLRQLYYHEHGLRPWQSAENGQILKWIGDRETLWDSLEESDYQYVQINDHVYEPFDSHHINEEIHDTGFVYGAGLGIFGKPQFFLARVNSVETIKNNTVYHLNDELCTDLIPAFALCQNHSVYIRRESLVDFLFYKFRDRKSGSPMDVAFTSFGLHQSTAKNKYYDIFLNIADTVEKIFVVHEISEIVVRTETYSVILSSGLEKHYELAARAVKDAMADFADGGTLMQLIADHDEIRILFFSSFMNDYYQFLIPDIVDLLHSFHQHRDYILLESKLKVAFRRVKMIYNTICDEFEAKGLDAVKNYIRNESYFKKR